MSDWFYTIDGRTNGPVSSKLLKQLAEEGVLRAEHEVRRVDWTAYVKAGKIGGLFALGQSEPSSRRSPQVDNDAQQEIRRTAFREPIAESSEPFDEPAEIYRIALAQRRVLLCVLAAVVLSFAELHADIAAYAFWLTIPLSIAWIWCMSELITVLEVRQQWLCLITCMVPIASLAVLARMVYVATQLMRTSGFRIGLIGTSPSKVANHFRRPDLLEIRGVTPLVSLRRAAILTTLEVSAIALLSLWGNSPPPLPVASTSPPVPELPFNRQREMTLAYWNQMNSVLNSSTGKADTLSQAERLFRGMAVKLRAIPTLGVDTDAVTIALEISATLDVLATDASRSGSGAVLAESFMRGFQGDPFGTALSEMKIQQQRKEELNALNARVAQVRALLTARYGIAF